MAQLVLILREGVLPGNKYHAYVLRRLLRQALSGMYLRDVNMNQSMQFVQTLAESVDNVQLTREKMAFIIDAIQLEIERFAKVLQRADKHFNQIIKNGELPAETAFEMKATRGIPEELIKEFCREHDIEFPENLFVALMDEHRVVSRK